MAPQIDKDKLQALLKTVMEEASIALATLKDKGASRFGRTIGLGAITLFLSYWVVYAPPQKKMRSLAGEIARAKTTAEYADRYKDLKDRLVIVFGFLPPPTAIEHRWLETIVIDSMKAENVVTDSVIPPMEQKSPDFTIQKQNVDTSLKFSEMISWLNRLETTKPMVHVGMVNLTKKSDPLGTNAVSCEIGTAIPTHAAGQP